MITIKVKTRGHGGNHRAAAEDGDVFEYQEPVKVKPRSKRGQRKRTWR